jgi:plastocyanin
MNRVFRLAAGAMVFVALLVVFGCSWGAPTEHQMDITDSGFSPAELSVKVGDTVTWTNRASSAHAITGNGFQSETLYPGAAYSHKFQEAGTYNFFCRYHTNAKGKITVR